MSKYSTICYLDIMNNLANWGPDKWGSTVTWKAQYFALSVKLKHLPSTAGEVDTSQFRWGCDGVTKHRAVCRHEVDDPRGNSRLS